VKWIIDAQLPYLLSEQLNALGHDSIHTLDLPSGNRTTDIEICNYAEKTGRTVVTKDRDFLDTHLLHRRPPRLLWITTGNIKNQTLLMIFETRLSEIEDAFSKSNCIEFASHGLGIYTQK